MTEEVELINNDMSKKEALTYLLDHLENHLNEIYEIEHDKYDWSDGFNDGSKHICYEVMKLIDGE